MRQGTSPQIASHWLVCGIHHPSHLMAVLKPCGTEPRVVPPQVLASQPEVA
jgi:hypothetical protein